MSSIKLTAASGGGSVALEGPASLGSDKIIKFPNSPNVVIQVKQTVKTDFFSLSTNDTVTDITGLSVDITPTSTSSKIFVSCTWEHSSNDSNSFAMFLLRKTISGSTTNVVIGDARGSSQRVTRSAMRVEQTEAKCSNIHFLDSPNTTSQVTYKLSMTNTHTGTVCVGGTSASDDDNRTSTPSIITVMEVSA